jgi:hypothetical protein
MKVQHPTWMYSAEGPRLFAEGESVPKGYFDSPAHIAEAKAPKKRHSSKNDDTPEGDSDEG